MQKVGNTETSRVRPVEGAHYLRGDGNVGLATVDENGIIRVAGVPYHANDVVFDSLESGEKTRLTRRVYLVPTDPAELVAELRKRQSAEFQLGQELRPGDSDYHGGIARGLEISADLVAEKLGVR